MQFVHLEYTIQTLFCRVRLSNYYNLVQNILITAQKYESPLPPRTPASGNHSLIFLFLNLLALNVLFE